MGAAVLKTFSWETSIQCYNLFYMREMETRFTIYETLIGSFAYRQGCMVLKLKAHILCEKLG